MSSVEQIDNFLVGLLDTAGLRCTLRVTSEQSDFHVSISGDDASVLVGPNGDVLYALEYLLNRIFARTLNHDSKIVCDSNDFRAARNSELCAMAQYAADQVRASSKPFTFSAMSASERRVIHEFLADHLDVKTESVNVGNERHLRIVRRG